MKDKLEYVYNFSTVYNFISPCESEIWSKIHKKLSIKTREDLFLETSRSKYRNIIKSDNNHSKLSDIPIVLYMLYINVSTKIRKENEQERKKRINKKTRKNFIKELI